MLRKWRILLNARSENAALSGKPRNADEDTHLLLATTGILGETETCGRGVIRTTGIMQGGREHDLGRRICADEAMSAAEGIHGMSGVHVARALTGTTAGGATIATACHANRSVDSRSQRGIQGNVLATARGARARGAQKRRNTIPNAPTETFLSDDRQVGNGPPTDLEEGACPPTTWTGGG
mmetsp:Transcript_30775/g.75027  ORF Transcript_30775/g.75027 Transcript_30775/m.75027 type:complete len:181 (-) Transcript_30775:1387-1929(-)